MKKFFTILLLLIAVELIPVSCSILCPCGCEPSRGVKNFDILSFGVETTSMNHVNLDTSAFHLFDDVVKVLFVKDKIYLSHNSESFGSGLFITGAYACSPEPISAIQKITDINIISQVTTTLNDENDLINKGDDLSTRFVVAGNWSNDFRPINLFVGNSIYEDERFRIKLNQKPFKETKLVFDIVITLSDGKKFELKNEILKVR